MLLAGFKKTSLIDYPGKIATIVFTIGCNFNCYYCHNSELIKKDNFSAKKAVPPELFFAFLEKRKKILEAVVITGGEPTLQPDLKDFCQKIKKRGLAIKLDTNGTNPALLEELVNQELIDYVAMDIKAPLVWEKYQKIIRVPRPELLEKVKQSKNFLLKQKKIKFEFRTTVTKDIFSLADFQQLVKEIKSPQTYYLQNYVSPEEKVDKQEKEIYNKIKPLSEDKIKKWQQIAQQIGQRCEIR